MSNPRRKQEQFHPGGYGEGDLGTGSASIPFEVSGRLGDVLPHPLASENVVLPSDKRPSSSSTSIRSTR